MSMYGEWPKVDGKEQRARPVIDFTGDKGRTVQADRDDADINKIIARLEKGGMVNRLSLREPFYGDVSEFGDLADSIMKVQKAKALFEDYDASLRERFDNDPVKFVEFFEDEKNLPEAIELGLALPKPVVAPPAPVPPVV